MKLLIPKDYSKKIEWWLHRCDKEWSGVAYYTILKTDELGFPEDVELSYFNVLDVGSHTETEWFAKDLAKAQMKFFDRKDIDFKACSQGLIHSHNTMSCFFSAEDNNTLKEHAPDKGFFFSLIVSSNSGSNRSFAISYKDQYGFVGKYDVKDILEDKVDEDVPNDWLEEIEVMKVREIAESAKKKTAKDMFSDGYDYSYGSDGYDYNYGYGYNYKPDEEDKDDKSLITTYKSYFYHHTNGNYFIRDLDKIFYNHIELDKNSNKMFFFDGIGGTEYTNIIKRKILVIKENIEDGFVNWDELREFCLENDINQNEFLYF